MAASPSSSASSSEDEDGPLQVDLEPGSSSSRGLPVAAADVDPEVCPSCGGSTYIGDTIGCSSCPGWFHFQCVGVKHGDPEVDNPDMPYYCPRCRNPSAAAAVAAPSRGRRGKRRATSASSPSTAPKRKRGRPRREAQDAAPTGRGGRRRTALASPPIKLKINLGRGESVTATASGAEKESPSKGGGRAAKPTNPSTMDGDEEEEEEEDRWLQAVEKGDLTGIVDPELRSIKNPELMTARQRAMMQRDAVDESESKPDEKESVAELAEVPEEDDEAARALKEQKSLKRKEFELEKREQDKKKTVDKLLRKKEVQTGQKPVKVVRSAEAARGPTVTYIQNAAGISISMPPGHEFPMKASLAPAVPVKILCGRTGCKNPKNYTCSKTGVPLCSLECYKENIKAN